MPKLLDSDSRHLVIKKGRSFAASPFEAFTSNQPYIFFSGDAGAPVAAPSGVP